MIDPDGATRARAWLVLERALLGWAAISLAVSAYDMFSGGFSFKPFGLRLSSEDPVRPFQHALVCGSIGCWLHDRGTPVRSVWDRLATWAPYVSSAAAVLVVALTMQYGAFVAAGSDAYGYVSQASLWASGRLTVPEPLAHIERAIGMTTSPLGYRPALQAGSNVPTYAPGLPLTMALAMKMAGDSAVYAVVPLLAALSVWLTYVIGRRLSGPRAGLVAAVLLAFSPIFLFQSMQPMSDVPVTAWFLAAWALALRPGRIAAAGAGVAISAAILTRPNLAPLAAFVLAATLHARPRMSRGLLFCAAVVPGCLAVAAINQQLFGSPSASGYGRLSELFEWKNVAPNLRRYPIWLLQQQGAGILLACLAPFVLRGEQDAGLDDGRRVSWWMLAFVAALLMLYLLYGVFDEWPYLRFLLPGIPLLLVMAAGVVVSFVVRLPPSIRGASLLAAGLVSASSYLHEARRLDVFGVGFTERRYEAVGGFVKYGLPQNAVVLTMMESGSVRWYSGRPTLRWDTMPPDALARALRLVREGGYEPYILLEDWEEPLFRNRFHGNTSMSELDWPAMAECPGPITVKIYRVDDRALHRLGQPIVKRVIPHT